MNSKKYLTGCAFLLVLLCTVFSVSGCGSGGGGGTPPGPVVTPGIITGKAIKGPISGGTVTAYAVTSGAKGDVLGTTQTDPNGNYSIPTGNYSGPVFLEITGGSYTDEATDKTIYLPTSAGSGLQVVVDNVSEGGTVQCQITPLTTMAVARAQNMPGGLTASNISAANQEIGAYFGGIDILNTQPINPLVSGSASGASDSAVTYGLILAGLSQQAETLNLSNPFDLFTALAQDISDGTIDGKSGATDVNLGGSPMDPTTGTSLLATAINTFSQDTTINASGGAVPETLITLLQNYADTPSDQGGSISLSWTSICIDYGITTINVNVVTSSGAEVAAGNWSCSAHEGTITDVPTGADYIIRITGTVTGGMIAWRGEKSGIGVTAGETTPAGAITMAYTGNDTAPPVIIETTPSIDATGVPVTTMITAIFSEKMAESSINDSTFSLKKGATSVTGSVVYDTAALRAVFLPSGNLSYASTYTATLTTDIEDMAGNKMESAYEWSFTTEDAPPTDTPPAAIPKTWAKTYGGEGSEWSSNIQQTSDGGYILAGSTDTYGSNGDIWVIKLDENGDVDWQMTYGGENWEWPSNIQQTSDGGYILVGSTYSYSSNGEAWIIKLDGNGGVSWQKIYDSEGWEWISDIRQTSDDGYIVIGSTTDPINGNSNSWVMKLYENGGVDWETIIGTEGEQWPYSIQQISDGGYIIAGATSDNVTGSSYTWVTKLNVSGEVLWRRSYAGEGSEWPSNIQQTSDGGYIMAGSTYAATGGYDNAWVMKLDVIGEVDWRKAIVGEGMEGTAAIRQIADGGYIVAGSTSAATGVYSDVWVMGLNDNGSVKWQKAYGGEGYDGATSIHQTSDGGYIMAGYTDSFGAGKEDIWILKLDPDGNMSGCMSGLNRSRTSSVDYIDTTISPNDDPYIVSSPVPASISETPITGSPVLSEPATWCTGVPDEGRPAYTLTVIEPRNGVVTSNPGGINCGDEDDGYNGLIWRGDCTHVYSEGTMVTLTATPSPGSSFSGWSGDADCSDGQVTMDTDKSCTATFNLQTFYSRYRLEYVSGDNQTWGGGGMPFPMIFKIFDKTTGSYVESGFNGLIMRADGDIGYSDGEWCWGCYSPGEELDTTTVRTYWYVEPCSPQPPYDLFISVSAIDDNTGEHMENSPYLMHHTISRTDTYCDQSTLPGAPTGVSATPGDGQVSVNWAPVNGATSYNVYMASENGVTKSNYNTLSDGMMHSNVTSPFVHTRLNNGTTYYFVVTAVNVVGESDPSSEVSATPEAFCDSTLPDPALIVNGTEDYEVNGQQWTRYLLDVTNYMEYPDALFVSAPHLPPCGLNTNASRTWVNIYDNNHNPLYGFCGLDSSESLNNIWFSLPMGATPPDAVYITMSDRQCDNNYISNLANIGGTSTGNTQMDFASPVNYDTGEGSPWMLSKGDFDLDGDIDLAVANFGNPGNVSVLMNNGDGTFASPLNYYPNFPPEIQANVNVNSVTIADLNGDDIPDLAAGINSGASVFLNNGNGTFAPSVNYSTEPAGPTSALTAIDIDNDGDLDLSVAGAYSDIPGTVSILVNNGDGSFASGQQITVGTIPLGITAGDFDADGDWDIATANNADSTATVLLNDGNGTFSQRLDFGVANYPEWISNGDLNGDGKLDIVVATNVSGSVSILFGNSNETLFTVSNTNAGGFLVFLTLDKVDMDNDIDIIVADYNNIVSVLSNNGDGTFSPPYQISVGSEPQLKGIVSGDFDGNGTNDIAVANYGSDVVSVLLGIVKN